MGWGRMFLLGDLGQQLDIQDQRREIDMLRRQMVRGRDSGESTEALARVAELERENMELRLYLAATIRYLSTRGVIDPKEFRVLVEEIDAEDGMTDGNFGGPMV